MASNRFEIFKSMKAGVARPFRIIETNETFDGPRSLTHASGFLFARDERIYLVTSRHVVIDEPSAHHPDRLEIELHTDAHNLAQSTGFSVPLYRHGRSLWRQGADAGGDIDVAVIELERQALPPTLASRAFTPAQVGQHILGVDNPDDVINGVTKHRDA